MKPDLDTLRPVPWHPATVLVHGRPPVGARATDVLASPAADPAAPAGPAGRARADRQRRHRAGVHRVPQHLRGGVASRLPRPRAGQPLQRRLLAAGHRARGAADPPHPQRDGRRRAARWRTPRASATSASTRSTSATARRCSACDEHAIYKNGAKEIAAQEGYAITFMAKFNELEGNSCHIHCSLGDARTAPTRSARTSRCSSGSWPASSPCMRELTLFFAPQVNSYKRFAEGSFAPTAVAWGQDNRTCSLRAVGHGPSLRIENRLPGRRREPLPGAGRDDRRRACTGSRTSWSSSRRWRATPTTPTASACPPTCATRATCSRAARWPATRSARTWWTTTSTAPRGARRLRGRRDRLGALPGLRAAL